MKTPSPLSDVQKTLLKDFYAKPATKVTFNTVERKKIWDEFKLHRKLEEFTYLNVAVPAIFAEISKALRHEKNIQPAVFSECVYAQAFADKFNLSVFENHINSNGIKFDFSADYVNELASFVKEELDKLG